MSINPMSHNNLVLLLTLGSNFHFAFLGSRVRNFGHVSSQGFLTNTEVFPIDMTIMKKLKHHGHMQVAFFSLVYLRRRAKSSVLCLLYLYQVTGQRQITARSWALPFSYHRNVKGISSSYILFQPMRYVQPENCQL